MKIFEHRSTFPGTAAQVMAFYSQPNAPTLLTPPPIFFQIRDDRRESLTSGEIAFTLWFGPIPFKWLNRHEPGPSEHSFTDRMLEGPMKTWVHVHGAEDGATGVTVFDRIQIEHNPGVAGLFTRLFFDGLPLRILFLYRTLRTRAAVGAMNRTTAGASAS